MATIDNRFPTEGTQIDMEARLAAIETALATLMTNTTGQAINTTLQSLVGAISPSADNVSFDNTGTQWSASTMQALGVEVDDTTWKKAHQTVSGGVAHTISNLVNGDIIIFSRNGGGMVIISNSQVVQVVALSNVTINSLSSGVLNFTRSSSYGGEVTVLSKNKVTIA